MITFKKISRIIAIIFLLLVLMLIMWQPHGIFLYGSVKNIRTSILEITPLGTSIKETQQLIRTKMHPDTLNYYKQQISLPPVLINGKLMRGQWPRIDMKHDGKQLGSQIGHRFFSPYDVYARWTFDSNDQLIDIFVYRIPRLP